MKDACLHILPYDFPMKWKGSSRLACNLSKVDLGLRFGIIEEVCHQTALTHYRKSNEGPRIAEVTCVFAEVRKAGEEIKLGSDDHYQSSIRVRQVEAVLHEKK